MVEEVEIKTRDSVKQGERYNEKSFGDKVKTWQYISKTNKEVSMIGIGIFRADMSIATAKAWFENKEAVLEAIASEMPLTDAEFKAKANAEKAEDTNTIAELEARLAKTDSILAEIRAKDNK